jgi:NhaP-type Na+/H+ or K+/H+ antiporter
MVNSVFLAVTLDLTDPYVEIIAASIIIILSFIYNQISEKTNIPSVLLLILTGIGINLGLSEWGIADLKLMPILELLGIVGLIMIVLEAALDLELTKEKLPMIGKSLLVAFLCLMGSSFGIALIIQQFYPAAYLLCLLYAIPLSIMSSAIIIPSVAGLVNSKKEFLIYESAFSDILGIMFFYFIISLLESGGSEAASAFGISLLLTIIVGVVASYALIYLFKDIKGQIRLFLLIAVLLILYAAGKLLHLSPLLIILIFGIMLANHQMFFRVFKNFFVDEDPIEEIQKEFHLVTLETAFVVRTFFFVVFGMTIHLSSLLDLNMMLISLSIIAALYVVRVIFLRIFLKKDLTPELWIAPRGLITILLFFAIPQVQQIAEFDSGILLYVIIITSLIMTIALIVNGKKKVISEKS